MTLANKEDIEAILEKAYESRYYTKPHRYGDASQQEFAELAASKVIDMLVELKNTGTLKAPPVEDEEHGELFPDLEESEKIGVATGFKPPTWRFSGRRHQAVIAFFTPEQFRAYVQWVYKNEKFSWDPISTCFHHTAWPNLEEPSRWKNGWDAQLLINARYGYINDRKFSRFPHIFTDQNGIWVMNPLSIRGTHASSYNYTHFGIEALLDGDDKNQVESELGQKSLEMGMLATAILIVDGKLDKHQMRFHKHDPRTTKTCPGKYVLFEEYEKRVFEIIDTMLS